MHINKQDLLNIINEMPNGTEFEINSEEKVETNIDPMNDFWMTIVDIPKPKKIIQTIGIKFIKEIKL